MSSNEKSDRYLHWEADHSAFTPIGDIIQAILLPAFLIVWIIISEINIDREWTFPFSMGQTFLFFGSLFVLLLFMLWIHRIGRRVYTYTVGKTALYFNRVPKQSNAVRFTDVEYIIADIYLNTFTIYAPGDTRVMYANSRDFIDRLNYLRRHCANAEIETLAGFRWFVKSCWGCILFTALLLWMSFDFTVRFLNDTNRYTILAVYAAALIMILVTILRWRKKRKF